jgi:TP901 family phage tail tape measure protein
MAREIAVTIVGDARQLERAFGRAKASTDSFSRQMQRAGRDMTRVGGELNRKVTLPIVGVGFAASKMGLDFGKAMNNIRALVGASDKQMRQYERGVLRLAKTTPQGPQALAEALYFVTSSGFEGASALKVLEASAKAAAAGLGDTTQVADAVTSAVNAYGEANLSASRATDILLATVREGKAEPTELAEAIGRVIAPAQAMSVEFQEVGGAVAGLSLGGLDAAESVTALRGVLASFLKPTQQASKFLKDAGLSAGELREQIATKGLLPTLQDLRDRFGDNQEALAKLFPNVRALNGFLALTGENAGKNAKVMEGVADSVGDTNEAFAKSTENAQVRLETAWSKIRVALIEGSANILPAVGMAADEVSGLAAAFGDLDPRAQQSIIVAAGIAAALGPLISIVGNLTLAVRGLGTALQFVARNPIVLLLGGLAVLGLGFRDTGRDASELEEELNAVRDALERLRQAANDEKNASLQLASARQSEKETALAVKEAEANLERVRKDSTSTKRDVLRAELTLNRARLSHREAVHGIATAEDDLAEARKRNRTETRAIQSEQDKLSRRFRDADAAVRKLGEGSDADRKIT